MRVSVKLQVIQAVGTLLQPRQGAAERLGWIVVAVSPRRDVSGSRAAPSGRDHIIHHAALAYSVIPFSSYV
jgi:hypothetical protein